MNIETVPSRDGGLMLIGGLGPLFLDRLLERSPWREGRGLDHWAHMHEWRVSKMRNWLCMNRPHWPNFPPSTGDA